MKNKQNLKAKKSLNKLDLFFYIIAIISLITLTIFLIIKGGAFSLVVLPFIFMLVFKLWSLSDDFIKFKSNTVYSFSAIKSEMSEIKIQITKVKRILEKGKK